MSEHNTQLLFPKVLSFPQMKILLEYLTILRSNFIQFELENLFRSKRKRIFQLSPYTNKAGRWTKRIVHIASSNLEKTIKKHHEEKSTISY